MAVVWLTFELLFFSFSASYFVMVVVGWGGGGGAQTYSAMSMPDRQVQAETAVDSRDHHG